MVSWRAEWSKQKNAMREKGQKKESPLEVSEKAYLSSVPEESQKSKGALGVGQGYLIFPRGPNSQTKG